MRSFHLGGLLFALLTLTGCHDKTTLPTTTGYSAIPHDKAPLETVPETPPPEHGPPLPLDAALRPYYKGPKGEITTPAPRSSSRTRRGNRTC